VEAPRDLFVGRVEPQGEVRCQHAGARRFDLSWARMTLKEIRSELSECANEIQQTLRN
jgi:hypothetical protein